MQAKLEIPLASSERYEGSRSAFAVRSPVASQRPQTALCTSRPPRGDGSDIGVNTSRFTCNFVHPVLVAPGVVELLPLGSRQGGGGGGGVVGGAQAQRRRGGRGMPLRKERWRVADLRRACAVHLHRS